MSLGSKQALRVGILTFHDGMNHGGYFQAWCLARFLRNAGHPTRIIHYRNPTHLRTEYKGLFFRYNPRNILNNLRKVVEFRKAFRHLDRTPFTLSAARVAAMDFDAVVVGSDIVWNYEWARLGQDRIYFGRGLDRFRKVAYAPSCGSVSPDSQMPADILALLRTFHALSVRDTASRDLLRKNLGLEVPVVLDPTLLHPPREGAQPVRLPARTLLVYAFALTPGEIAAARRFAAKHRLISVAVGYPQRWCDRQLVWLGPFAWLYCFQQAHAVLTSTFHGTIFSLLNQKPFHVSLNEPIRNKVEGLLRPLGLESWLDPDAAGLESRLACRPDYTEVEDRLRPLRAHSARFLTDALA